jgi:anti-sigma factor RsiW
MIPTAPAENHAAVVAWVQGGMNPAQRQEFEAHLATCAECQAAAAALLHPPPPQAEPITATPEPAPPVAARTLRRNLLIAIGAAVILLAGYALGWWAWQLAHR